MGPRAWFSSSLTLSLIVAMNSTVTGCTTAKPVATTTPATMPSVDEFLAALARPDWPDDVGQLLHKHVLRGVAEASSAEVQIVTDELETPTQLGKTLTGSSILRSSRLSTEIQKELAPLLTDKSSYRPRPEFFYLAESVNIRFLGDAGTTEFVFSSDHHLLRITWYPGPPAGPDESISIGSSYAANFSPVRPQFIRLLKKAWPAEPAIQNLSEKCDRTRRTFGDEILDVMENPESVESMRIQSVHSLRRQRRADFFRPFLPALRFLEIHEVNAWGPVSWAAKAWSEVHKERPFVDWYILKGDPRITPPAVATLLRDAVLDDQSYEVGGVIGCFDPGTAFRFTRGTRSVTLLVCLECHQVKIRLKGFGALDKEPPDLANLSPDGRQRLVGVVKRAFPDDAVIQKLE